jgi:hypothetical protein
MGRGNNSNMLYGTIKQPSKLAMESINPDKSVVDNDVDNDNYIRGQRESWIARYYSDFLSKVISQGILSPNYKNIFDSTTPSKAMFSGLSDQNGGPPVKGNCQFVFRDKSQESSIYKSIQSFLIDENAQQLTNKEILDNYTYPQRRQVDDAIRLDESHSEATGSRGTLEAVADHQDYSKICRFTPIKPDRLT